MDHICLVLTVGTTQASPGKGSHSMCVRTHLEVDTVAHRADRQKKP